MVNLIKIRVIFCLIQPEQIAAPLVSEYILNPLAVGALSVGDGLQIVDLCHDHRAKHRGIAVKALDVLDRRFKDRPAVLIRKLSVDEEGGGIDGKMATMDRITKNSADRPDSWTASMRRDVAASIWNLVQNLYCKGSGGEGLRFLIRSLRFIRALPAGPPDHGGIERGDFLRTLSCLSLEFKRFEEALEWIESAKAMDNANGPRPISPEKQLVDLMLEFKCRLSLNQRESAKEIFNVIERHQKCSAEILMLIVQESLSQSPGPLTLRILEKAMDSIKGQNGKRMENRNKMEITKQIISGAVAAKWTVRRQRMARYFRECLHSASPSPKQQEADEFAANDIKFVAHNLWRFLINDHGDGKMAESELAEFIEIGIDSFDRIPDALRSEADRKCLKWLNLYRGLLAINALRGPSESAVGAARRCLDGIQSGEHVVAEEAGPRSLRSLDLVKFKCFVILDDAESAKTFIVDKPGFSEKEYLTMIRSVFRFEMTDKFEIGRLAMAKVLEAMAPRAEAMENGDIYRAMLFRRMMISWNVKAIGTVTEMEQNRPYFEEIVAILSANQFRVSVEDGDVHSEWKWLITRAFNHAVYYISHSKQQDKAQYIEYLQRARKFLEIAQSLEQFSSGSVFTAVDLKEAMQRLEALICQQRKRTE